MLKVNEITNVVQLFEFSETINSGSLTKNQNQRIVRSNYFQKKKFNSVFMKEQVILWPVICNFQKFETCSYIPKLGL